MGGGKERLRGVGDTIPLEGFCSRGLHPTVLPTLFTAFVEHSRRTGITVPLLPESEAPKRKAGRGG